MIGLTIAGDVMPLSQITIRRDASGGEMDLAVVGYHDLTVGAEVVFSIDPTTDVVGAVSDSTPSARSTRVTASLPIAIGSAVFEPAHVLVRSDTSLRAALDFSVLPGDTWSGLSIAAVTHTMGTSSPWFTEVRF